MDPNKQRDIASKGGKAAHAQGKAHEWTREEAKDAGHKGGATSACHHLTTYEERAARRQQARIRVLLALPPPTASRASLAGTLGAIARVDISIFSEVELRMYHEKLDSILTRLHTWK